MSNMILVSIVILVILLIVGIPVPAAFFGSTIYLVIAGGYETTFLLPYSYSKVSNYVLLAIPLFIIAGGIIEKSDLGAHLVEFVNLLIGRVKGSLGLVAVVSCALFGSVTGSAAATMSVIGSIMWPRMDAAGYDKGKSAALISSGCLLGGLIPPSSLMIMYAWIAQQSVIKCFMAILVPGIITTVLFCITYYWQVRRDEGMDIMPHMEKEEYRKEFKKKFIGFVPAVIFPVIILGGINTGIMTPTESASVSLIYALLVGFFIYRTLTFKAIKEVLLRSASTIGVIMVMLYMVTMLSRIYVTEGVPTMILDVLTSISGNKYVILLLVNLFLIILGMLMDDSSATLLSVPILLPIIRSVGMDPIQFAAIIAVNISLGCITPPCAPLLYLGARLSKTEVIKTLKPTMQLILFVWIPALLLVTYVPQLSLFLPSLIGK